MVVRPNFTNCCFSMRLQSLLQSRTRVSRAHVQFGDALSYPHALCSMQFIISAADQKSWCLCCSARHSQGCGVMHFANTTISQSCNTIYEQYCATCQANIHNNHSIRDCTTPCSTHHWHLEERPLGLCERRSRVGNAGKPCTPQTGTDSQLEVGTLWWECCCNFTRMSRVSKQRGSIRFGPVWYKARNVT